MADITVVDTIMGAGKTSFIIEYMNRAHFDGVVARREVEVFQELIGEENIIGM